MTFDPNWAQDPQKLQQLWTQAWGQTLQAFKPVDVGALATSMQPLQAVAFSPEKLAQIQKQYMDGVHALWNQSWGAHAPAEGRGDRRFAADEWGRNPLSAFTVAAYDLQVRTLTAMADAVQADEKTRARIRFSIEQFLAASAPSNFLAFNVEAQKKALQTQGESLAQGLANLLKDIQQGHISMTDESRFKVGENVATTEGAVVFENDLFQLIEYKPLTAKVHERPFLMVPPCINKYYILDLQPDNSFIRHAVSLGHRTFVVSWRNPDMTLADKTWDDYIEGAVIQAIQAVKDISGARQINALGFCVGGTMLSNALAVLAARGDDSVASATFLTTLIDFTETGVLDVFIDENFVRLRELQMGQGGLMKGRTWLPPSASCGPTTWCGTTSSATTSRARRRPRSTCCTGTATAPTCPAPTTPGTCATSIWKTSSCSPAASPSAARSSTSARSSSRSTSTARARTTSCPSAAPTPPPSCCRARSAS